MKIIAKLFELKKKQVACLHNLEKLKFGKPTRCKEEKMIKILIEKLSNIFKGIFSICSKTISISTKPSYD